MDLMEGTATAVIKAPEDVKRKQCEILESCCGSDGIPSLEKVFGIHVILESGQEFTCSDVDCRRKTVVIHHTKYDNFLSVKSGLTPLYI